LSLMYASDRVIPADVLVHHIFPSLPAFSLVCASIVCQRWRKLIPLQKREQSHANLLSLFEHGAPIKIAQWFENILMFPVWNYAYEHEGNYEKNLSIAAKGNLQYISIYHNNPYVISM
jgi:hypothetical protein